MDGRDRGRDGGGWTRAGLVRTAIGAGAVAAGGAAISGSRGDDAASLAAAQDADADILNFFLLLEYVQEGFYRESAEKAQLDGELLTYAQTVLGQEGEHIAFLEKWLGARARAIRRAAPRECERADEQRDRADGSCRSAWCAHRGPHSTGTLGPLRHPTLRAAAGVRPDRTLRNADGFGGARPREFGLIDRRSRGRRRRRDL